MIEIAEDWSFPVGDGKMFWAFKLWASTDESLRLMAAMGKRTAAEFVADAINRELDFCEEPKGQ